MKYKALHVEEKDGRFTKEIQELDLVKLDKNDILIRVKYSALNFKDALSAIGNKGITREYPHTPGIDGAGIVERSNTKEFKVGDEVIVTSFDLGMNTNGAFSQYISVPKEWVIPLPKTLSLKEAVAIGTAGLTAAIGTYKLLANGQIKGNKILVSGATGAVGSFSVKLLSSLGFEVTALSSKADKQEFLTSIGAKNILLKEDFETHEKKPLLKPKFDGAIDVVGGELLENLLKQIKPEGSVAICGLVSSAQLNTTVFPFILRGINLLGINSAELQQEKRNQLWQLLANEWKIDLSDIMHEHSLEELPSLIDKMLTGQSSGRAIITIN
ncbi:YhdH/YhfP family quinone oxidoreductase [Sulfurospirillum arcachonense]|uniref:YhdH/YhfP family quinone oxidoreductase n=1 Tax=Sulfurospirillum arcachonense TaxID=57666 RepID=UPI00046A74CA|nr:YhdH/YhfP family quinone oxidoreductase [Sulfurospirillum arcachonense]